MSSIYLTNDHDGADIADDELQMITDKTEAKQRSTPSFAISETFSSKVSALFVAFALSFLVLFFFATTNRDVPLVGQENPSSSSERGMQSISRRPGSLQHVFTDGSRASHHYCGNSVAISKDGLTVAMGCPASKGHTCILFLGCTTRYPAFVVVYRFIDGKWKKDSWVNDDGYGGWHRFGAKVALNYQGTVMAASDGSDGRDDTGKVQLFTYKGSRWYEDLSFTGAPGDWLGGIDGLAVSASGRTVVMSAPGSNEETGSVTVRMATSQGWVVKGQVLKGVVPGERFGNNCAVNADGSRLVVGGTDVAIVYEYNQQDSIWEPLSALQNRTGAFGGFSQRVAMTPDGSRVIVGSKEENESTGRVRVYDIYEDGKYKLVGLALDGANYGHEFGHAVSISDDGNWLLISAPKASGPMGPSSGHVYLFTYSGTDWDLVDDFAGNETLAELGSDVAISGNAEWAVAGAQYSRYEDNDNCGKAFVFRVAK